MWYYLYTKNAPNYFEAFLLYKNIVFLFSENRLFSIRTNGYDSDRDF